MSPFRSRLTLQTLEDRTVPSGTPADSGAYPPPITAEPPAITPAEPVAPAPTPGGDGLIPPGVDAATAAEIVKRLTAENATLQAKIDANNAQIAQNNAALPGAEAAVKFEQNNAANAQAAYDAAVKALAAAQKAWGDSNAAGEPQTVQGPLMKALNDARKAKDDAGAALAAANAKVVQAQGILEGLKASTTRLQAENTALALAIVKNNELIKKYSPAPAPNTNSGMAGSP